MYKLRLVRKWGEHRKLSDGEVVWVRYLVYESHDKRVRFQVEVDEQTELRRKHGSELEVTVFEGGQEPVDDEQGS